MDKARIEHYRLHMKLYEQLIVELAGHDVDIIKFITGENSGGLLSALRKQIADAPINQGSLDEYVSLYWI